MTVVSESRDGFERLLGSRRGAGRPPDRRSRSAPMWLGPQHDEALALIDSGERLTAAGYRLLENRPDSDELRDARRRAAGETGAGDRSEGFRWALTEAWSALDRARSRQPGTMGRMTRPRQAIADALRAVLDADRLDAADRQVMLDAWQQALEAR